MVVGGVKRSVPPPRKDGVATASQRREKRVLILGEPGNPDPPQAKPFRHVATAQHGTAQQTLN